MNPTRSLCIGPATWALLLICLAPSGDVAAQPQDGEFIGEVVTRWLHGGDNRSMVLVDAFAFRDPEGKLWRVPAGTEIDGASIPPVLWSSIGAPFVGPYRRAAVVHDYYSRQRTEPWRSVHRMFYDAMLLGGVSPVLAKVMYGAVFVAGPRWGPGAGDPASRVDKLTEDGLRELEGWVREKSPTLAEIERYLEG